MHGLSASDAICYRLDPDPGPGSESQIGPGFKFKDPDPASIHESGSDKLSSTVCEYFGRKYAAPMVMVTDPLMLDSDPDPTKFPKSDPDGGETPQS